MEKNDRTRRESCVESCGLRGVAAGPQEPGWEGVKVRNTLTPSSLLGDPFWSNPRELVDADCAGQPLPPGTVLGGEGWE